jgi:hypothetical protein
MLDADFKAYYPVNVTNTAAHGGRMSNNMITSGEEENVFRNKSSADRAAGCIEYEKVFAKAADDADATLVVTRAYLAKPCEGDDWCTIFAGTQTDVLSAITGWETGADAKTKYGTAWVTTNVVAASQTIKVTVDNALLLAAGVDRIFRVGDKCKLADDSNSEEIEIAALAENGLEITVTTVAAISRNYTTAAHSRLSSIMEIGTVATSSAAVGHTGGADYNHTGYAPLLDNIGTLEEQVLFTFADSTNFTATGDTLLGLGSGTVGADFTITNTVLFKPLAKFYAAGWSGLTIAGGDTFTARLHPAAAPIWQKRQTPAGAGSVSYSNVNLVVTGEVSA